MKAISNWQLVVGQTLTYKWSQLAAVIPNMTTKRCFNEENAIEKGWVVVVGRNDDDDVGETNASLYSKLNDSEMKKLKVTTAIK